MNPKELAWAAGFFDGEGCTTGRLRSPRSFCMSLQIGQVDPRPLERFRKAVGVGSVFPVKTYARHRLPNAQPYFRWVVASHEHVQAVVAMLWNYLSEPKREQATRVLGAAFRATEWRESKHGAKLKTHCKRGHSLDGVKQNKFRARVCLPCNKLLRDAREAKRRAA